MKVKVYNPTTGKEEEQEFYVDPKEGNEDLKKATGGAFPKRNIFGKLQFPTDDDLDKMEKDANRKAKNKNREIKRKIKTGDINSTSDELTADQQAALADIENPPKKPTDGDGASANTSSPETTDDGEPTPTEPEAEPEKEPEAEPEKEPEKEKEPEVSTKPEDHIHKYKSKDEIPDGVDANAVKKIERDTLQGDEKKADAYMKRWGMATPPNGFKFHTDPGTGIRTDRVVPTEKDKGKSKRGKTKITYKAGGEKIVQKSSYLMSFGDFIKEDVMKDMRKISKSKKDMEIKLDDGTEIPIDPMTAEIFVKYIEGLKSSEQKKVINQIQRTERGFMKVLGKAHGE